MRWYTDPVLLALIALCLFSGAGAFLAAIRNKQASPQVSPRSFLVERADGVLHTVMRRPVVDPPPCPDTVPRGDLPSPGILSPEMSRHIARWLQKGRP